MRNVKAGRDPIGVPAQNCNPGIHLRLQAHTTPYDFRIDGKQSVEIQLKIYQQVPGKTLHRPVQILQGDKLGIRHD